MPLPNRLSLPGALRSLLLCAVVVAPARAREAAEARPLPAVAIESLRDHVRRLASDEWAGRGTGSPGEREAARYVAAELEALGLEPAGEEGGWFQRVPVPAGFELGDGNELALVDGVPGVDDLAVDRDFRPFGASPSTRVEGELVFAGYGVRAPGLGYDDYAGLDVAGKVVVVFRHLPHAGGAWASREARRRHAPFAAKLDRAVKAGAAALLVANDPRSFPTPEEFGDREGRPRPDTLERHAGGVRDAPIPFVHLTRSAAGLLFAHAFGATPAELEALLHGGGEPRPAPRASDVRVRLATDVERVVVHGTNVCGLVRAGAPDRSDGIVVVGGHHDHLGRGLPGSLARSAEERARIHNGADDNASGTAGVLAVAAHLARRRAQLRRDVLVMTFTGEERGLVGSRWWCEHPTVPWERVVAMLNMDMIGRLEDRPLFVGGEQTSPAFRAVLDARVAQVGLDVQYGPGGRAPSDNTSFYDRGAPVLFFFSGMHPDYHRPSDDWDKVDFEGLRAIAQLVAGVAEDLARLPARPAFRKVDAGGFGPVRPVLGISVGPAERGVAVAGVVEGGPADEAGLVAGDVIVAVGEVRTPDVGALRAAMGRLKVGQTVEVTVLRGGHEQVFAVELGRA